MINENKIQNSPTIYLMCGFLGFGKTTIAKRLEKELPALRLTHDEIMLKKYGRNPDDFEEKYKEVDKFIRNEAEKAIKQGKNVILDYGFWTREQRRVYYKWGKYLTPNVIFYALLCDMEIAKQRVLARTKNNSEELWIDENCFNKLLQCYEAISEEEGYPIIYEKG